MKGEKEEEKPLEKENFGICGPLHLTSVDWRSSEHRRSIAACLVQGVFVLERDRQEKRTNQNALAPIWWNFIHFQCYHTLVDPFDSSIFGIIFEYQPNIPNHFYPMTTCTPPKYVIAFRGTVLRPETRKRDFHLDIKLAINRLARDRRYQISFEAIEGIIAKVGPNNVWLTGHSLGAAIALQAGKDMAKRGCCIETYLFNPPYVSAPIEKINDPALRNGVRIARSVLNAGLSIAINGTKNTTMEQNDPFRILSSWTPYLFLNPKDPICCEYIGYFEHREKMEGWGVGRIERIATKNSVVSLISGALGRDHGDALHLIPSAFVTKNLVVKEQDFMAAHGLLQWWEPHPHWQSKAYQFT